MPTTRWARCTACWSTTPPAAFVDEFAEVPIDASQVIWVATANDERCIPEPILNRMNVYEVDMPDRDAARAIALRCTGSIRGQHDWGRRFDPDPAEDVLDGWPSWPRARCAAPG
jgi:ATP-dependent Lon protease